MTHRSAMSWRRELEMLSQGKPGPYRAPPLRVVTEEGRGGWWNQIGGAGLGQRFQSSIPLEGREVGLINIDKIGRPQLLTVSLSRNDVRVGAPANNSDVFCRCQYGVGGVSDIFEVDWATGMQFSVTATSLRVSAVSFALNPTVPYDPRPLDLSAAVVMGARAGALPPCRSRSFNLTALGGGGSQVNLAIPDFARDMALGGFEALATTVLDANTFVDFLHFNGGILAQYSGTELLNWPAVVVPGAARTVTVRNTSANARNYTLTFGLCL